MSNKKLHKSRKFVGLSIAAMGAIVATQIAGAQGMRIEISGAERARYKIAVPMPLGTSNAAKQVHEALSTDLKIVGTFEVLDPRSFLANLAAEGLAIRQQDWLNVGAQGVVKARVIEQGNAVALEARFYEVGSPTKPAFQKDYRGSAGGERVLAHQLANDLYKHLTGEEGIFLSRIAYVRTSGRAKDIVTVDPDGGRVSVVVKNGSENILPDWSPSGDSLAYTSLLWLNPDAFIKPLGKRAKRISKRKGLNVGPVFSPDGKHIALTMSQHGNADLYLIRASDGGIVRRLTTHPSIDTSPSFSPGGDRIAFVSGRHGSPQIWVMPTAGGAPKRITFRGNYNQAPAWSPRKDASVIAFTGRDEKSHFDVFTVDLSNGNKIVRVTQGQGSNWEPTWAPNGRLLAFGSSRGGIWVATPDGQHQLQIVKGSAETPSWSPSLEK